MLARPGRDMEDDLDELLDEVESKFCGNVSTRPPTHTDSSNSGKPVKETEGERKRCVPRSEQHGGSDTEDIDALLEEFLLDDVTLSTNEKTGQLPQGSSNEKKTSAQAAGRKCCPVFLGGSSVPNGVGTAISQRTCDQLRCTSCDFRVLAFNDYEWDPSCDYLFLRNNMPDRERLRAKLKRSRGTRAYSCQCSWSSARDLADLGQQPQLRWVCGKHQA